MTYGFKFFDLGNDLSHHLSKDNLGFITICFVLLQYEVNLFDSSVKKKKKKNKNLPLYCFGMAWDFGCFFPPNEMSARGLTCYLDIYGVIY